MKKAFESLLKWIDSNLPLLQAFLIVIEALIAFCLSLSNNYIGVIISLLALIGIDFYIFSKGYLEIIRREVTHISHATSHQSPVSLIDRETFDWKNLIKKAEHDIYITGSSLNLYYEGKQLFADLAKKGIKVHLLSLNLGCPAILNAFTRMRYKDRSCTRYTTMAKTIKTVFYPDLKDIVEFAVSDRVTPMAFVAIDVDKLSDSSFIKVQHYLHEKEASQKTFSYLVEKDSPVFELFREQVQILWRYSFKAKDNKTYYTDESF